MSSQMCTETTDLTTTASMSGRASDLSEQQRPCQAVNLTQTCRTPHLESAATDLKAITDTRVLRRKFYTFYFRQHTNIVLRHRSFVGGNVYFVLFVALVLIKIKIKKHN